MMSKSKTYTLALSFILLFACTILSYKLLTSIKEKKELRELLTNSQNIINILHNKVGELLDDVQELTINHASLKASEIAISIYSDRLEGISHLNWFIPDFLPLRNNFAISQNFSISHNAIDFSTSHGNNVYAAATGIVIVCYEDRYLGNVLMIDHLNSYKTLYAHLFQFFVSVNDFIEKGQVIGSVGNTGNSTNPHLHFQIFHNNDPLDPDEIMDISKFQN